LTQMRLSLLGSDNALGQAVLQQAESEAIDIASLAIVGEACIKNGVAAWLMKSRPSLLLNTTPYVDGFSLYSSFQRLPEQEHFNAWLSNYCEKQGIILLQVSSYLIFDGARAIAYDEQAAIAPLAPIGKSLACIEHQVRTFCPQHLLLRFGWLLDESKGGYLDCFLRKAVQGAKLFAADDRRGNPTTVDDAARVLLAILKQIDCGATPWGTYHYGSNEASTEFALQQAILDEAKRLYPSLRATLLARPHELCPDAKNTPQHTVLSCKKILETFGIKARTWRVGLEDVLRRYFQQA